MKKLLIALIVLALGGAGWYAYYKYGKPEDKATVSQTPLSQGNIIQQVQSTGTLEALRTVQVGSQVSGVVRNIYVDFNSIVKKDQLLAEIDPSLLQVQVDIQKANIERQMGDIEQQKVQLENDKKNADRAQAQFDKQLLSQQALEQAKLTVKSREAQIAAAEKQLVQARANLGQAELNVRYTRIISPIDGVIVNRNVDVGQTVQASMQTPTFFTIATDLTTLKLSAGVDEADIGYIRPNMRVTFMVESYPNQNFDGYVDAVRLNASTNNNVVTYPVWITVNNPDLRLRPSMTANIRIVVDRADNVVRVPSQALRFRPTTDIYTWLGIPPPAAGQGRGRGANALADGGRGGAGGQGANAGTAPAGAGAPGAANAPGGQNAQTGPGADGQPRRQRQFQGEGATGQGAPQNPMGAGRGRTGDNAGPGGAGGGGRFANMTPEERQRMREQYMAGGGQRGGGQGERGEGAGRQGGGQGFGRGNMNMTPEQRAQFQQQFGGRGRGQGGQGGGQGGGRGNRPAANEGTGTPITERNADKIDELFAPVTRPTSPGQVWVYNDKAADPKDKLKQINVRVGLTDGQFFELVSGEGLTPGVNVVTGVVPPPSAVKAAQPGNNIFQQQPGRGGFGPGGGGFPGGGGPGGGGGGRGGGGGGGRGGN